MPPKKEKLLTVTTVSKWEAMPDGQRNSKACSCLIKKQMTECGLTGKFLFTPAAFEKDGPMHHKGHHVAAVLVKMAERPACSAEEVRFGQPMGSR